MDSAPGRPVVEQMRTPYSSSVRSNQARTTRRAIVAAAGELFVEQGYAATTIDVVAERAGVARKTVFSSVGGKGALLKLAWDWAIAGDDEPIAMSERPAVQAMLVERDPGRLVRMWVDMQLDVGLRSARLGAVVLAAADVDAEARALGEMIRRETLAGATAFVSHLAGTGGLRRDVSIERGAEACWALLNSLSQHLLVDTLGWSLREYGAWLVQVASTTLLQPQVSASSRTAPNIRVANDAKRETYEASVDGRVVAQLYYQRTDRFAVLTHTHVAPDLDDPGLADALVRRALDDVRADAGRRVIPVCPYVTWWVGRHPDYASLVYDATAE